MIVVTGGAGFIGSNIVARLCESGAWDVVVCDRLETADLAKWKNIAKHPIADLWAPEELFDQLERHAERIEANALRPLNAYGYSKYLFDQYAVRQADRDEAPPQWAGLKFFNVYGPNEGHKGGMKSVVAQIWPKVQAGETVSLFRSHNPNYPDGGQLRDFVFVDDVVGIILWLLENEAVSGVFNAGSGQARSFADLARATFAAAGKEPSIAYSDMPEAIRDRYQYFTEASMDRIRALGYGGQSTPLEEGVRRYVQDFLAQPDPYR